VNECTQKNTDGYVTEYLSLMANIGIIRYEDKGDIGNKKPDDLSKCKIVEKGNLVINSMNYGIGSYGLSSLDGICSPVYIVLQPKGEVVNERYALRIFEEREFQSWAQSFGNGILAHRCAIGWDDLKNINVALPPTSEQIQIARFLDHETARIDALIAEQQRLIELLKEKRQAVISHAVTKGLDPTAPMKDSGVEWLGEVPAHWEVGKFKWFLRTASGGTPPSSDRNTYYDGNIPWLRSLDLNDDLVIDFEVSVTQKAIDETSCKMVPENSVLIAMYGGDGTIGKNGLLMFDSAINQALCAFLPSPDFEPKYLHRYIQFYRPHWMINAESSRKDPNIGQDRIGDQYVLSPPMQEQREIAEFLDDELSKFDDLSAEANLLVEQLQERRSALISAAVTGKIDVRGWQAPASAAPAPTLVPLRGIKN
jgi:type I restriction enzyme S subunit